MQLWITDLSLRAILGDLKSKAREDGIPRAEWVNAWNFCIEVSSTPSPMRDKTTPRTPPVLCALLWAPFPPGRSHPPPTAISARTNVFLSSQRRLLVVAYDRGIPIPDPRAPWSGEIPYLDSQSTNGIGMFAQETTPPSPSPGCAPSLGRNAVSAGILYEARREEKGGRARKKRKKGEISALGAIRRQLQPCRLLLPEKGRRKKRGPTRESLGPGIQ